jgi:hypothetical protein
VARWAQRQGQGQADDQHQPAQADQQARGAGPGLEGAAQGPEELLLLGVVPLLDADGHPADGRPHDRHLGPQPGPARVRLGPGQGPVDDGQVAADPLDRGVDRGVVHAHALQQVQPVAEQGPPHLGAAQVADGQELLDLDVEQQRLALDVDQVAAC